MRISEFARIDAHLNISELNVEQLNARTIEKLFNYFNVIILSRSPIVFRVPATDCSSGRRVLTANGYFYNAVTVYILRQTNGEKAVTEDRTGRRRRKKEKARSVLVHLVFRVVLLDSTFVFSFTDGTVWRKYC